MLAALLTLVDGQQPAAPPQTFRSGTQIVEVDVRVLKDGRFVTDLTAADFTIAEDGVPQKIQSVTLIDAGPAPARAPGTEHSAPSTEHPAPTQHPAPSTQHPAVWLFVFDTAHMTPGPFQRAREAAVTFIAERFREGDVGGVVVDGKMANNRLTTDRAELKAAAEAARMPGELRSRQLEQREWPRLQDEFEAFRIVNNERDAISAAVQRACADDPDACRRAPADMQVMQKARRMVDTYRLATNQTLTTVNALCNGLAKIPGAKTIVFFSEGFVIQQMESQLRQAVGQAARAGAHFYTIDVRGLNRGSVSQIIDQPLAASPMAAAPSFDMQADGTNSLAVDTGGMAIRNENNFARALDEIQKDAGTYYVIAYAAANTTFDGKYRSIDVKVSRPGVKVRARRGYLALPPAVLTRPGTAVPPKRESEETRAKAEAVPPKRESEETRAKAEAVPPKRESEETSAKAEGVPPKPLSETVPVPVATAPVRDDVNLRASAPAEARGDAGKMVAALGKDPAAARLRPTGDGAGAAAERGWSAYERGDVETAARELGEAAKSPGARPWVAYALGLSQFALRQYRDAVQSWERVRRDAPEFEPIYFSLADAYGLQHEDAAALKVLRDAESRWPADAEVANAIGVIHVRRGALDAAIESFERATSVAPSDALGFFNLGRTLQMRLLKSQRYDRLTERWIGGDDDRRRAIASFEKYLQIGGPYERQAREALAGLRWK